MRLSTLLDRLSMLALVPALLASPDTVARQQTRESVVHVEDSHEKDSAWIGVWLQDVVDGGIQIVAVVPGSPAELAKLRAGDIILRGNAHPLPEQASLNRLLRDLRPGEPLELRVVRGDRTIDARLRVASRVARFSATSAFPEVAAAPATSVRPPRPPSPVLFSLGRARRIGVQVSEVTPALRAHYGAPEEYGVLVTRSESGGIAARSGIAVGDVIVRVGGAGIATSRQFEGALLRWNPKTLLRAELVRDGKSKTVELDATVESRVEEAQDGAAIRAAERELMGQRVRFELERLERRMAELRQQLEKLERDD